MIRRTRCSQNEWAQRQRAARVSFEARGSDLAAAQKELESCLLTDEEMAGGSKTWFALKDPFFEQWEGEQRKDGRVRGEDHGKLAKVGTSAYVLVLHKDKKFSLQTAVSVLAQAGIGADVGLRLVTAVQKNGQGIVVQGKEDEAFAVVCLEWAVRHAAELESEFVATAALDRMFDFSGWGEEM